MPHVRVRPNGRIQFDLHLYGQRFREGTKLMATPKNLRQAQATLKQMNAEIALKTFEYRNYFPHSKKVDLFEKLQREKHADRLYPYFDDFAREWFERKKGAWKSSYQKLVWGNLEKYLIPCFGNILISDIKLSHVDFFRQELQEAVTIDGKRAITNKRINGILWPFVAIMSLAAEEYTFNYPLRRYKALKEEKAESNPLSKEEVALFLKHVDETWRDYFIVRFWTGLRSCEVHGLHWKHIDFTHRLIRIRQNFVNGEIGTVKTPKSRRDLKMNDALFMVFTRLKEKATSESPFVFPSPTGTGLSNQWISRKLWYPTLEKANLEMRRPYETRHTSAVLHIAAHENPLYISHMLGHSDTALLFDIYAPYVANAARTDGQGFCDLMQEVFK